MPVGGASGLGTEILSLGAALGIGFGLCSSVDSLAGDSFRETTSGFAAGIPSSPGTVSPSNSTFQADLPQKGFPECRSYFPLIGCAPEKASFASVELPSRTCGEQ